MKIYEKTTVCTDCTNGGFIREGLNQSSAVKIEGAVRMPVLVSIYSSVQNLPLVLQESGPVHARCSLVL